MLVKALIFQDRNEEAVTTEVLGKALKVYHFESVGLVLSKDQIDWAAPSNQLLGMALCEKAATFFGENYMKEPWN